MNASQKKMVTPDEQKLTLPSLRPQPDEILARELLSPGTDRRYGLNFIARPPTWLVKTICTIQAYLAAFEPHQYYYPQLDLHMTLVEICHSRTEDEVYFLQNLIQPRLQDLVDGLKTPQLREPAPIYDSRGCAIAFLQNKNLAEFRQQVIERLAAREIIVHSRYSPVSAHVTFMRYLTPLESNLEAWLSTLHNIHAPQERTWNVSNLYISCGANWYGMQSCITQAGPYRLPVPRIQVKGSG